MESGAQELESITVQLERIASELSADLDGDRAAELVREASELAAKAGRAVEGALRTATDTPPP